MAETVVPAPAGAPTRDGLRRAFEVVLAVAWAAFLVHAVVPDGGRVSWWFDNGVYYALLLAATAGCVLRAVTVSHNRAAWALIGAGLATWTAGDVYYLVRLQPLDEVPVPSPADAGYLAYFPLVYVGVVLLMRDRLHGVTKALWIDGITAALTVTAVAGAMLLGPLRAATDGSAAMILTNLAYPLGDIVLLGLLAALGVAQRFRLDRSGLLLVLGLLSAAVADAVYLVQAANGTYVEGHVVDALWAASLLLIGAAAWRDTPRPSQPPAWRAAAALPLVFGGTAALLLVWSSWNPLGPIATALASGAIVSVLARLAVTLRENTRLLSTASSAAVTDPLTGLPNRRALACDLDRLLGDATPERPLVLALFDLNGFKTYNDRFGHPAGDALLRRLGARLRAVAGPGVATYRLGGDEFALVTDSLPAETLELVDRAASALSEQAEGFAVTASFGAVTVPEEADTVADAFRIADARLYTRKAWHYATHDQPQDELLRVLEARDPERMPVRLLASRIAGLLGCAHGLSEVERADVTRATLLRDVGTLAVPDDICRARRPLTPAETDLLHQHPVIGERVLSTIPALRPLAPILRASHEHWDGSGYPDGRRADAIPLPARIAALAIAYAHHRVADGLPHEEAVGRIAHTPWYDPSLVALLARAGDELESLVVGVGRDVPAASR